MKKDLIKRARESLESRRRLRSAFLRRAVSDSYYALFHALAELCADSLVGVTKRGSEAWRRAYRGLEHGFAKNQFKDGGLIAIGPRLARTGSAFISLQDSRHTADYDPRPPMTRRSEAEAQIALAETAIAEVDALPDDIARDLAVRLLVRSRV
jgi:hypothetical protein